MSSVFHLNQVVQVLKERRGNYASVNFIDDRGGIVKRDKTVVVKFPEGTDELAASGSLWVVSGRESVSNFTRDGYFISEYMIKATSAKYLKPSGRVLSRWISSNVPDIGFTIADRLARTKDIEYVIANIDRKKLLSIDGMNYRRVDNLLECWPSNHLYKVIEWLDRQRLPLGIASKLIDIFEDEALETIKANPFLLMSMGLSFEKTMEIANDLKLDLASDIVLAGVAQHFASSYSFEEGGTVVDAATLVEGCREIVGQEVPETIGEIAVKQGLMVEVDGGYQTYGAALQETAIATFLTECLTRPPGELSLLAGWEHRLSVERIEEALAEYEATLSFSLTDEQRAAIRGAAMSPVCGISGGAGTGKTTILAGVLHVIEALSGNMDTFQVALSGRAAQRMSESTGRPAQSIAKLTFDHIGKAAERKPPHLLLVIDEASMVDLLSMYRLVRILPHATRIIFVGDIEQLPPVGAGLIFHALLDTHIPFFELSQVKRQGEQSGIHKFAMSIRNDEAFHPGAMDGSISQCSDCVLEGNSSIERLVELWEESTSLADSIVLSPIRKGTLGVVNINRRLQAQVGDHRTPLSYLDEIRGWTPWCGPDGEFLLEGDQILITKNNYDKDADLRNGDLGFIDEVFSSPDNQGFVGTMNINGRTIGITKELLSKMSLGYAITVHKSQGSQWNNCIVTLPPESGDFLDKSLLYTAVTRPKEKLILMGRYDLIEKAVRNGSAATKRNVYMRQRLMQAFKCLLLPKPTTYS
jgi:exodeoxyribonuclease V alpha subunit